MPLTVAPAVMVMIFAAPLDAASRHHCVATPACPTLKEGRLITKREALEVLASLGAPAGVVRDIYQRRYLDPQPASERWRTERGEQARTYLRERIRQALGLPEETSSG